MVWALPFLIVVGVLLPVLAWSTFRHLANESASTESLPSPEALAVQTIAVQAVVMALAWLALAHSELQLSWTSDTDWASIVAAAAVVLAGLKVAQLEARRPLGSGERLRRKLRGVGLTKWWLAAIGAAAIGEEFAYRGVLFVMLGQSLPSMWAALISALCFGLAHLGQGWRGALLSAGFGLGLQVVVVISQGLFLGMLAHLLYDLGVVWLARRLARRESSGAA